MPFWFRKTRILLKNIEFDANVDKDLPWRFIPKQRRTTVITGETALIFYESENIGDKDIIGTSVYNITPMKAGKYFVKIHNTNYIISYINRRIIVNVLFKY